MADAKLLDELDKNGEASTSIVLDTLMYCESLDKRKYEGWTVDSIVNDLLADNHLNGDRREALESVRIYMDNSKQSEVANLKLSSCSDFGIDDEKFVGAHAATFYKENDAGSKDVYVAFKGTGDGRWYDNGDAFAKDFSPYQRSAAKYFDKAMEHLGVDDSCKVITTGHSKGGNLSQYVALGSKHSYLVDKVLSYDGQGFSPEAIEYLKNLYGEEFFYEQCQKMFSISGDNDFVNVLGIKIIPEENTVYIITSRGEIDVANAHALFVNFKEEGAGDPNFFDYASGKFFPATEDRRRLSLAAENLSDYVMSLPADKRGAICRTLMAGMEIAMSGDETNHIFGERYETASINDILEAITNVDDIVKCLLNDESVQSLIDDTLGVWLHQHDPFLNNKILSKSVALTLSVLYHTNVDKMIVVIEALAYSLTKAISTGLEVAIDAFNFCVVTLSIVKTCFKRLSSDYKDAQEYLSSNSIINCDTAALRGLADRIRNLNSRLSNLDYELSCLYSEVKWTDLWDLQRADMKIGYSNRLQKCADYLSDTADRFEAAESEILGLFG